MASKVADVMDPLWTLESRERTLMGMGRRRGNVEEVMLGEQANPLETLVIQPDHNRMPPMVSTPRHGERLLVAYPPRLSGDMDQAPPLFHEFGSYDPLYLTSCSYDSHVGGGRQGRPARRCGRFLHETRRRL